MPAPPTGTVTFLFTDIQGSTRLWELHPDAMRPALARHDDLLRESIEGHEGHVFKTVGDAFCAAFPTADTALQAALAAQRALAAEAWKTETPLLVRMALHTGSAEERGGDYFGQPLNRVAGSWPPGMGGRCSSPRPPASWSRTPCRPAPRCSTSGSTGSRTSGGPSRSSSSSILCSPPTSRRSGRWTTPPSPTTCPSRPRVSSAGETQVEEVKALLAKARLLTLLGTGGAGKTRLSLQVAADLLTGEGDGVWLVELAALADPALVPQAIADVLGIRSRPGSRSSRRSRRP